MDAPLAESPSAIRARLWFREYGYILRQRCFALLGNAAAADDALQEVFVRVLKYGDKTPDRPLAWLKRIADRCCFDLMRAERRQGEVQHVLLNNAQLLEPWPAHDPDKVRAVLQLLARTKPKLQRVAVLFYFDEMTRDEIAKELGCSTMTVKRRLAAFRRFVDRTRATAKEKAAK